jgi:hypothetical protein
MLSKRLRVYMMTHCSNIESEKKRKDNEYRI